MKILTARISEDSSEAPHLITLFGLGLIGSAILSELELSHASCLTDIPTRWSDLSELNESITQVEDFLDRTCSAYPAGRRYTISVVWSAGEAGFAAPEGRTVQEFLNFQAVLALGDRLASRGESRAVRFFLVSSAGGLFEGQKNVSDKDIPTPLRPYGNLKLQQESALLTRGTFASCFIYRPSSVYGHSSKGRTGLISALLSNGLKRQVTSIYGAPTTLRDFVSANDIGRFITRDVLATQIQANRNPTFLVSGKPSSIFEVIRIIEGFLGRKLYVQYDLDYSNALDNTYSRQTISEGWATRTLTEGIQDVFLNLTQHCL